MVTATVLMALSWWQGYHPSLRLTLIPIVMLAEFGLAVAVGLAAAASLIVLSRDLKLTGAFPGPRSYGCTLRRRFSIP